MKIFIPLVSIIVISSLIIYYAVKTTKEDDSNSLQKKEVKKPSAFTRIIFYLIYDFWKKPFLNFFVPSITIIASIFWLRNAIKDDWGIVMIALIIFIQLTCIYVIYHIYKAYYKK